MDDSKKIGIGLTGFGLLFFMLGVMLFFDRGLLAMGNILFLSGVALTIGPSATLNPLTCNFSPQPRDLLITSPIFKVGHFLNIIIFRKFIQFLSIYYSCRQ